jgi:hypothetical protein
MMQALDDRGKNHYFIKDIEKVSADASAHPGCAATTKASYILSL